MPALDDYVIKTEDISSILIKASEGIPAASYIVFIHNFIDSNQIQDGDLFISQIRTLLDPLTRRIFDIVAFEVGVENFDSQRMLIFLESMYRNYYIQGLVL